MGRIPTINRDPIRISSDWQPRWHQEAFWRAIRFEEKRRAIIIGHRRWGKDELALNFAFRSMLERKGNYWHMLPEGTQARKAIWSGINEETGVSRILEAFPLQARQRTLRNDMMVELKNGSTYQIVGSDNYDSLVGSSPVGIVFSEWALADPECLAYLRPIVSRNNGWMIFITTPRGKNHAYTTLQTARANPEEWYWEISSVAGIQREGYKDMAGTDVFTNEQLQKELQELIAQYGEEQGRAYFEQEYECSFDAPILGAFYSEALRHMEAEGRIREIPIDRAVRVHTAWDLGVSDSTAIWFIQCVGRERRLVDYYESSGAPLQHYVEKLLEKKLQRRWIYADHWFPHDVKNRELIAGMSRAQTLESLGIEPSYVPAHNPLDGINAVRRMLDRSIIDPKRCERGLEALKNYRREWNDKTKDWGRNAYHDWSSHGADAIRTFAAGYDDPSAISRMEDRSRPKDLWGDKPTHWSA
jgi:phage terminase large subunit